MSDNKKPVIFASLAAASLGVVFMGYKLLGGKEDKPTEQEKEKKEEKVQEKEGKKPAPVTKLPQKGEEGLTLVEGDEAKEGEITVTQVQTLIDAGKSVFFSNRLCPFAHRAWLTMTLLGVADEYQYVHINLGPNKPAAYAGQFNASGTVPHVYVNGKQVSNSLPIVNFFAEYHQKPLPGKLDAFQAAAARNLLDAFDTGAFYGFLKAANDPETRKAAIEKLEAVAAKFEKGYSEAVAESKGPYFGGKELSIVEIATFSFLYRFNITLTHFKGYDLFEKLPTLRVAMEKIVRKRAFRNTAPPADNIKEIYTGYCPHPPVAKE